MISDPPKGARTSSARYEQIQLLHRMPLRLVTNVLNSGLVVVVAWEALPQALLLVWFGLMCGVTAVRYLLCRRFSSWQPDPKGLTPWARNFTIGAALTGALWGAATSVIWLTPDITYHVFLAFVIAGMSAAAVATSYPHLPSVDAFLLPAVAPLAIGLLLQAGNMHLAMGLMVGLYLVFLLIHARMSNKVLLSSLHLQEENTALIADLSASRRDLEQRVRERTSELEATNAALQREIGAHAETEHRLRRSQKLEAVGQLTGGLAHDFNNLLAVIQGNAEFMIQEAEPGSEPVQAILRASTRGAELTQRLLAFSRQQPLRPKSVDLMDLVAGLLDLVRPTLGETIEIETTAEPDLWNARVDPGQIENALLNLAINARDAMPSGGRLSIACSNVHLDEVYVSRNPESLVGDYVAVTVSDTGVGMSAEVLEHAVEPFFTTKDVGQGSGLGLSMVYGFAQQSRGHVVIESELGQGTSVTLYLPRDRAAAQRSTPPPVATEPRGEGELILVIEDDPDLRKFVVKMLRGLGYRVIDAADSAGARDLLASEPEVDLILSDVVLPGNQSGPALGREVKALDPKIKLLFMSGYPAEATARAGILDPDLTLLHKPFHKAELAMALRAALDD